MKTIFKAFFAATLFAVSTIGVAQVAAPYQVATWPGFRSCAVSYTFDDGCSGQFAKAIPVFDEFNYKLTLFTVSSWISNWDNLQNAAKKGHEVANHTATHPGLNTLSEEKQEEELRTSNELIDANVTSQKSVTMATPYCAQGNDKVAAKFFIATRGCQGFIEAKTPANFMNVSAVNCGDKGPVMTAANFKTQAEAAASKNGWLVYLLHGVDNDGGYSAIASDTLKKSLEYLKANDNAYWVTTFGNAARYIKERDCVLVKETSAKGKSISLSVTDTLSNNAIFNHPLTFRRLLPKGWKGATVAQNGDEVSNAIVEIEAVKYIQFDAVPDGGSVVITRILPDKMKK
jgi:oligosaccharide reducing-end xylanase